MLSYAEYRNDIEKRYEIKNKQKEMVERFIGNRALWIWGASEKSHWLPHVFDHISGYIDRDEKKTLYNGKTVIRPEQINPQEMYIYVALDNQYTEVRELLAKKGMNEYTDYLYPGRSNILLHGCDNGYGDVYGNEIEGSLHKPIVNFCKGIGSVLKLGKNCCIDPCAIFRMENNSIIIIEDNVVLEKDVVIDARNGGIIHIGKGAYIMKNNIINSFRNSYVHIGEKTIMCPFGIINAAQHSKVFVGEDTLFSSNCHIQPCDGHQFYDINTQKSICAEKIYEIEIGKHVWVGRSCTILYGAKIGSGSIVGIDSMVKNYVPSNVVVAGRPAGIIRKNVVWEMPGAERKDNFEELSVYDFRS